MLFKWTMFMEDRLYQFGWTIGGWIEEANYADAYSTINANFAQVYKNILSDDCYITAVRISRDDIKGDALLNTYGTGLQGAETGTCIEPATALLLRLETADHFYHVPRWLHRISTDAFNGRVVQAAYLADPDVTTLLENFSGASMRLKVKKKDAPGIGTITTVTPTVTTARGMTQKKVGRPFSWFHGRHKRPG